MSVNRLRPFAEADNQPGSHRPRPGIDKSLDEGELHRCAILKLLEARVIEIAASLLYRKLKRLMEDGWLVAESAARAAADDTRRRYYRLTPLGRAVVPAEAARIVELARSRNVCRLAAADSHA